MPTPETLQRSRDGVTQIADTATSRADAAIEATKRVTTETLDSLHDTVAKARVQIPEAFSRAAGQVEQLTRRSLERARDVKAGVSDQVTRAGDRTVGYVRDEPVKALLIAAAAGAAVALLARFLARSRQPL